MVPCKTTLRAAFAFFAVSQTPACADDPPIPLPLVQDIPASKGYEGRAHDVLGIQFGDTREEATAKLKAAFPEAKITEQSDLSGLRDQAGVAVHFDYVWGLTATIDGNPRETVLVRFTTPATGGRVFAVTRDVTYSDDRLASMQAVKESITQKYGKPTLVELYPHQSSDEITYTFEKRQIKYIAPIDVSKGQSAYFTSDNQCATDPRATAYDAPEWPGGRAHYKFKGPVRIDPERSACIGAIKFTVFYGRNPATVRQMTVEAVDYDRTVADNRIATDLLTRLQREKSQGIKGSGAPRL